MHNSRLLPKSLSCTFLAAALITSDGSIHAQEADKKDAIVVAGNSDGRQREPLLLAQPKTVYIIKSVGTLGGDFSDARNLNDKGEVVGVAQTAGGHYRAFVYANGKMTDLGTLGGNNSVALAISRDGKVVGTAEKGGAAFNYATSFSRSGGPNIDLTPAGTIQAEATAINDQGAGEVAGITTESGFGFPIRAFRQPGSAPVSPVLMPTFGGTENRAYGINDSGDIVGSSLLAGNAVRQAFLFTGGNNSNISPFFNLGDLGGTNSEARDINNSGRIVGWSDIAGGGTRAFLRSDGAMVSLGSLGGNSFAHAINDSGDVVGTSKDGAGADLAFLYKNGTMTDLNTLLPENSGWTLHFGNGINENGQIVGYGTFNGAGRGFLMEPDRTAPVVKPVSRAFHTSQSSLTVSGTAIDEGKVEIVQFRVGGKGPFREATGTTSWRIRVPLAKGLNRVEIRARDTAGLFSRVAKVRIMRS